MALNSLFCADVPLSNYSLTTQQLRAHMDWNLDRMAFKQLQLMFCSCYQHEYQTNQLLTLVSKTMAGFQTCIFIISQAVVFASKHSTLWSFSYSESHQQIFLSLQMSYDRSLLRSGAQNWKLVVIPGNGWRWTKSSGSPRSRPIARTSSLWKSFSGSTTRPCDRPINHTQHTSSSFTTKYSRFCHRH